MQIYIGNTMQWDAKISFARLYTTSFIAYSGIRVDRTHPLREIIKFNTGTDYPGLLCILVVKNRI